VLLAHPSDDSDTSIHHPPTYAKVLQPFCHEPALDPLGFLVASDDPASLAAYEGNEAAKLFACIRRYNGEPRTARAPAGFRTPADRLRTGREANAEEMIARTATTIVPRLPQPGV